MTPWMDRKVRSLVITPTAGHAAVDGSQGGGGCRRRAVRQPGAHAAAALRAQGRSLGCMGLQAGSLRLQVVQPYLTPLIEKYKGGS